VAGGGSCSWHDFAVEIFAQTGVDCRVDPATTAEVARPAPRPAFSVLASERADAPRLPDWREGLAAYLAARTLARASA
jgi:dTDP-4-dehydrorhamnose reductase